ncbi:uncharacterized protein LOC144453153 [Glandiceps talaboti]
MERVKAWLEGTREHMTPPSQGNATISSVAVTGNVDTKKDIEEPLDLHWFKGFFARLPWNPATSARQQCLSESSPITQSTWTERQRRMLELQWNATHFPSLLSHPDAVLTVDLSGISEVSRYFLQRYCLKFIMQWLLGTGTCEPPVVNESEVLTVTVSDDVKAEILKEIAGSFICKVAMAIREATEDITVKTVTKDDLYNIIMTVKDVPKMYLNKVSVLFLDWLNICKSEKLEEKMLNTMMQKIIEFVFTHEEGLEQCHQYEIRHAENTRRQCDICDESKTTECSMEVRVCNDDPENKRSEDGSYKVLTISENKISQSAMDRAYPQMVCQFIAAAKDAHFNTENHNILYNVSICGKYTILLSRAHVLKSSVETTEKSVSENSHMLYRAIQYVCGYDHDYLDVFPVLNVYMAFKATLLLHKKTTLE